MACSRKGTGHDVLIVANHDETALRLRLSYILLALCLASGCGEQRETKKDLSSTKAPPVDGHLFTLMPSSYTGVRFENRLQETHELNVFTYRNFYNGGGVAGRGLNVAC